MHTEALNTYLDTARSELSTALDNLGPNGQNHADLTAAAHLILDAKAKGNRLHVSGIGKPSYVAGYGASLISSTGTPAYVLHGTEAVHGSAGQLVEGDIVILISNSGETQELLATAHACKANGTTLIALTGNPESTLAKLAKIHLTAHIDNEGGPLNRAPRTSVLSELLTIQALSVLLQAETNLSPEAYVRRHPGGSLGKLRDDEK